MKSNAAWARAITVVLLAALGLLVVTSKPPAAPTPRDAIYAMLGAARSGDVATYLDSFAGPLAASLAQSAAEQGDERFARSLREANEPVKGIAINEPQSMTDREARLRVELIYQDRNETQILQLEKQDGRWRIVRLGAAQRVKPSVPYGSPASTTPARE